MNAFSKRQFPLTIAGLVALLALPVLTSGPVRAASDLPPFFTYLRDVDASILQEMRYYGRHNFLGRRVKGYEAGECILTKRAAMALSAVQKRLKSKGLSLKVYDCYRPQRAVDDFLAWSRSPKDQKTKPEFYPTLDKKNLFSLGYIARRSAHSRGSTVDLAIVPLPAERQPAYSPDKQVACFEEAEKRYQDNSLDFGTGYDCFHELSHTRNPGVGEIAKRNRQLLVSEMAKAGFNNYSKEWWHFTLANEPYARQAFNFPIKAREGAAADAALDSDGPKERLTELVKKSVAELEAARDQALKPDVDAAEDAMAAEEDAAEPESGAEAVAVEEPPILMRARVICVPEDDVLNVRDQAGVKGQVIASLPRKAVDVVVAQCNGTKDLGRWHLMDRAARRAAGIPWCEIKGYRLAEEGELVPVTGWVSGAFLVPDGHAARSCLAK